MIGTQEDVLLFTELWLQPTAAEEWRNTGCSKVRMKRGATSLLHLLKGDIN